MPGSAQRSLGMADKDPLHRTLHAAVQVVTRRGG